MSEQIYLARDGQQTGPYTRADLAERAARGEVQAGDFAWQQGQPAWLPAHEVLAALGIPLPRGAAAPPPLPAAARPRMVRAESNVPAGHLARVGASMLDSLLTSLVVVPVMVLGGWFSGGESGAALGYSYVAGILLAAAYFGITQSGAAMASLGKRATGLIVLDKQGQRIGFLRAALRYIVLLLGGILWIPTMLVLFNRRHRGLHDMIMGTVVIEKDSYEPELWNYEQMRGRGGAGGAIVIGLFLLFFITGILAAIAIPAYQDYTIRAKVSAALIEARPVRAAVAEKLLTGDDAVVSYEELEMPGPLALPQYGATVEVEPEGVVVVRFDSPPPLAGKTVAMTPIKGGAEGWHCGGFDGMPDKYLPLDCRSE